MDKKAAETKSSDGFMKRIAKSVPRQINIGNYELSMRRGHHQNGVKNVPVDARTVEGVQHCHDDNCDEYYYRPLVYGNDLFTYIAHIPPGGNILPDQGEADMFELSLYVLAGQLEVIYGTENFSMRSHMALHCAKGVPIGFDNPYDEPASLIMSFAPSPQRLGNPERTRLRIESLGRSLFSADEMNQMAGELFSD